MKKTLIFSIITLFSLFFSLTCLGAVMPEDFGARVNDGIDDTLAFQQAIDVAISTPWALGGGKVLLNAGTYDIDNPPLRLNSSVAIEHDGSRMCVVQTSDTNHSLFVIDTPHQVIFKNIWIRVWPAQSGVDREIAGILVKNRNCQSRFENLQISGFGTGIRFESAHGWKVEGCYFVGNWVYGIWIQNYAIPDAGDSTIISSIFHTPLDFNAESAIFQEAGGGLRLVNNKILGHKHGYKMELYPRVSTSILIINSNSIENQAAESIYIDTAEGSFAHVIITGNQINCGVYVNASSERPLRYFNMVGNALRGNVVIKNVIH